MSGEADIPGDTRLITKKAETEKLHKRSAFKHESKKQLLMLQEKKKAKYAFAAKATSAGNLQEAAIAQNFTEALAERALENSSRFMLAQRIKTLLHHSRPVRRGSTCLPAFKQASPCLEQWGSPPGFQLDTYPPPFFTEHAEVFVGCGPYKILSAGISFGGRGQETPAALLPHVRLLPQPVREGWPCDLPGNEH